MSERQPEWVAFDLDGTLIDSERIWDEVRRDFVTANGGRWCEGAQQAMMGMRTQEWAEYLHRDLGVALSARAIAEGVVQQVIDRLTQRLPILAGASAVLARLANAFELGLATSAALPVAQAVLEKTGWNKIFAAVVSADEVARGKPAPDVYLRVVEALGADRAHTAAIEDSGNGIRSAHAAGLAVVAIPNLEYPPEPDALALAARVIPRIELLDAELIREAIAQFGSGLR